MSKKDIENHKFTMTIDGKAAATLAELEVINPAQSKPFTVVPDATKEQVDKAVKAAQAALVKWSKDEHERRHIIAKIPQLIRAHQDELARLLTLEQGKPLTKAMDEIASSARTTEFDLKEKFSSEKLQTQQNRTSYVVHKPIGVVAVICPWNYPVHIAVKKIIPALIAGDTVVVKPAPTTPVTTLYLGELLRTVLPAGVCNIISGGDKAGAWLCEHPDVAKISFTGSVATGKKIAQVAAQQLKRVTLELGGNDPAIVLADVDIDRKAKEIFWGAFANCGQICVATKRLYVHESIYEPMVKALTELADSVKVGNGLEAGIELGPLNNKEQLARVEALVADAKAHGAKIETGGERLGQAGYFYKPTIVTGINEGVRLVDEEQFGPVLPVMPFKTEAEAIARANNSTMGLGASVWSSNKDKGWEIANQLEAGVVWVNHIHGGHPNAPFGGFKNSGIGRENGRWGLEDMTEVQSITMLDD